jgi:RNA polymerase sigma-70 factor (ECF subfamily)
VQAAIAACHASASTADATDWLEIAGLYDQLFAMTDSPVVALNRAVAISMAEGPATGLLLLDALEHEGALAAYYLLPAARADLLRQLGRAAEAVEAYRAALSLVTSETERRYLERRLDQVMA